MTYTDDIENRQKYERRHHGKLVTHTGSQRSPKPTRVRDHQGNIGTDGGQSSDIDQPTGLETGKWAECQGGVLDGAAGIPEETGGTGKTQYNSHDQDRTDKK